jgi:hypothetical protein
LIVSGNLDLAAEPFLLKAPGGGPGTSLFALVGGQVRGWTGRDDHEVELAQDPVDHPRGPARTSVRHHLSGHARLVEVFRAAAVSEWLFFGRPIHGGSGSILLGPNLADARIRVQCRVVGQRPGSPGLPDQSAGHDFPPGPAVPFPAEGLFARFLITMEIPTAETAADVPVLEWVQLWHDSDLQGR